MKKGGSDRKTCFYHPDQEVTHRCDRCGGHLCALCLKKRGEQTLCSLCAGKVEYKVVKKRQSRKKLLLATALVLFVAGFIVLSQVFSPDLELEKDDLFEYSSMDVIAAEAFALVEDRLGRSFQNKPELEVTSVKEYLKARRKAYMIYLSVKQPRLTWKQRQRKAGKIITIGEHTVGLYWHADHRITMFWDRMQRLFYFAGYTQEAKPRVIRMVLIHEAVHALDEDRHQRISNSRAETKEERKAYNALLEGHAEIVTQQIADETGDKAIFEGWIQWLKDPANEEQFPYHYGRLFWDALSRRKVENLEEKLFQTPPTTREQIVHPEKYVLPD